MTVQARCVTRAWDSNACVPFEPGGGPLPGGLYGIDRDGPLASLKLGSTWVFEFDRCAPSGQVNDYTCKKCGATKDLKGNKFTLNTLGTHTRMEHNDGEGIPDDSEEEAVDLSDRTCNICNPPKVLKTPHGLTLHNQKSHPFQSQPEKAAVAATA